MILLYIVAFVAFVTFLLYSKWTFSYWSRRGVVGPPPIPIFGNMIEYFKMKKHFGEVYNEIYQEFPGAAYVGFYKFGDPAILIRSLELTKCVLMDNFKSFQANDVHLEKDLDPLLSMNPFFVRGDEWKYKRSQVTPILTAAKIKSAFPLVYEICQRFAGYIEQRSQDGHEFEARNLSSQFTIESVASCAFGVEAQAFTNERSSFVENTKKMFEISTLQSIRLTATFFLPTISRMVNLSYLPGSVDYWLRSVIKQVIRYRDEKPEPRTDLLQSVLDMRNRKGAAVIDEETIVGHALTILTDGYETSSGAMCYCFYQLAVNPEIQRRVQAEVDAVLAECNGVLNDDAIKRLVYTERVIYETLRLHTPDFSLNKICTEDFELPAQYTGGEKGVIIAAGTSVVIPVYSLHRDPEIFDDPLRFDPDRFTDLAKSERHKCAFLGFGEGPRMCPGIRFALMQSKAAIATVLSRFDVHLSPKTVEPLTFSKMSLMMTCDDGIFINFKKRTMI